MTGHWVMLLQFVISVGFMFFAVRAIAGTAPAFAALLWLVHTRNVMQRLTGGLPRGWALPVLTGFLYFVLKRNHRGMLLFLLIGCVLHPPATMLVALAYGLLLIWDSIDPKTRAEGLPKLKSYVLLSPVYLVLVLFVLKMPTDIGSMASFDVASSMPEFFAKGRFPFLPLTPALEEMRNVGLQAFLTRFYDPGELVRASLPVVIIAVLLTFLAVGILRKREVIPRALLCFLVSIVTVYFLSRILAFKLYVPDRHLQFPLAVFFISSFTIGAWRIFEGKKLFSSLAVLIVLGLTFLGSGTGIYGVANFNYPYTDAHRVFTWLRKNTPENALIAGHPTYLDPVQLFAVRRGYATTETAHPFYDAYYKEIKRRLEIDFKAYYSAHLRELSQLLLPEGVDYFVFRRRDFYPEALEKASYFKPFDTMVHDLASREFNQYSFRELPSEFDPKRFPFVPYRDDYAVVVDLKELSSYMNSQPNGNDIAKVNP